uniref:Uncharacterized protein n=1 Tax=Triticum urartu TaxID=4572 RepID=A0A8R7PMF3_TRIUA
KLSYLLCRASGQLRTGRLSSVNPTAEGVDDGELAAATTSGTGREPTSYATDSAAPRRRAGAAAAARRRTSLPPTRYTMTTSTSSRWWLQRGSG